MVTKLQEDNRRLLKDQSPNHSSTIVTTSSDSDMLQRLKDSIEKQRDEIRLKEKLLQEKADDVENVNIKRKYYFGYYLDICITHCFQVTHHFLHNLLFNCLL